ncbi:MAG: S-layer protein domain-containing protein [Candidatus Methanoperedens sp.]
MNITWYINGTPVQFTQGVTSSSYIAMSAVPDTWTVEAIANNNNGTDSEFWTWIVTAQPPSALSIIDSAPPTPVTDIAGASRTFSIGLNQTANVTWYINGTQVQINESVTAASYTNSSAVPGTWVVKATAISFNGTDSTEWIWNVKDITPPGNVTNLTVVARGQTDINWAWQNPPDPDFNGVSILIDDNFITDLPKTSNVYNASGLSPGASHKITVIAFDLSGNNATQPWPENTSTTLPNTLPGNNVIPVGLPSGVTVSFNNVSTEGNTTVSFTQVSPVAPGFVPLGNYADITTSAGFKGNVTITLSYPQPQSGFNESNVRLYHLNNNVWEDVTTNLVTANHIVTGTVTNLSLFVAGVYPPPAIKVNQEPSSLDVTVRDSLLFNINVDQAATVTWTVNGAVSSGPTLVNAGGTSNFTFTSTTVGNYSIMVMANNTNGTNSMSWNITFHPMTFFRGNRIWDGGRPDLFSLKYTWNPMSFSGFYYDINSDVGNENLTMTMNSYTDRTINAGNIVYDTAPEEVKFGYTGFGSYQVIGFMADKYFAGYTANTLPSNPITPVVAKSALAQGQLHKVLMDDDTKRTISVGGTLALQEGYVLKAVDIDLSARTMLISLLKDGNIVDSGTPLSAGQTYVYAPSKVGAVSDLPIIMVRFDSVFSGTEVQAAFLVGLFQISDNPTSVKTGDVYNDMKVTTVGQDKIEMSNNNDVTLGRGNTENLMGNMNILVADNDTLRFALSTEPSGPFEVRSTVYRDSDPIDTWTPYNFGMNIGTTSVGFYYDLNSGIGNENLRLLAPLNGRSISAQNLVYTTTPEEVPFGYSGFGSYQVIGFMADKYFAGYTANTMPPNPTSPVGAISALAQGQLHKVLIDDDTKRSVSVGSTIALQEGYVLKAVDIDLSARTMLVQLLKDGNIVDPGTPLSAGQTYVYAPSKVGAVSDLPIIMVRFDSVFAGTEVQAAFLVGLFQISDNPTTIKTGDVYNDMKVTTVGQDIEMSNNNDISLDNGNIEQLMGNIKLKVGDTSTTDNALRFYFAVDVTPEMVANQLVINAPDQATGGDTIGINVTAGGNVIGGASVAIDASDIGQTDNNGTLNYTLPRTMKGLHNITATELGYQQATKGIDVLEYIERRLSIDVPTTADQFGTITIKITYNGTAVGNAAVSFDNTTIGLTDSNGALNYTLETNGTHAISASKDGYVAVVKDIDIRAPFSKYEALDINITPNVVFTGDNAVIISNITNAGTKKDTIPVELIINGTAVDNNSVTLAPGEIKQINFTKQEAKAGNYTVEILGQKGLLVVKERPLNLILIALIATGLGLIAIYLLTAKNKISFEGIRKKLNFERWF